MIDLGRLIQKDLYKRRLRKEAMNSHFIVLHSFISRFGYPVNFYARIVSNKLAYSVVTSYQFYDTSFYDGNDFNEAFNFYVEMVSAVLSISAAEEVKKQKSSFLDRAKYLLSETSEIKLKTWNTPYQVKKSYWGIADEF